MSGRHATATELELYVLGALDADRVEGFEAHCAECASCAAALSGEARLEVAFEQVARRPVRLRVSAGQAGVRAAAYGAAGLVAMAAAMLVWLGRTPPGSAAAAAGEVSSMSHAMDDGAILDARNDALDGG
jgi:hypothetical protein